MKIISKFFVIILMIQTCLVCQNDYYAVNMPSGQQECFTTLQDYIAFRESWKSYADLEGDTPQGRKARTYYEQLLDPADVFAQHYQTQREICEQCYQYKRDKTVLDEYLSYNCGS